MFTWKEVMKAVIGMAKLFTNFFLEIILSQFNRLNLSSEPQ